MYIDSKAVTIIEEYLAKKPYGDELDIEEFLEHLHTSGFDLVDNSESGIIDYAEENDLCCFTPESLTDVFVSCFEKYDTTEKLYEARVLASILEEEDAQILFEAIAKHSLHLDIER